MAYKGKAHSTSNYGGFFEENAFRPGIQTEPNPRPGWSSAGVFPQIVWFQFEEQKTLTKIGFSTRANEPTVSQAPKKFEVAASVDCQQFQSNAEVLLSIEDAGFEKMNQARAWMIPEEKQAPYLCIGIKVYSVRGPNAHTALQNVVMWEKRA